TATASPALAADAVEPGRSLWQDAWARLRRNRMAVIGGVVLIVLTALSLLGPLFLAYSYEEQNLALGAAPPSAAHLLGTDKLGRDQLARLFFGGRVSLLVGLAATSVSLTIGVLWGSIAGYAGGKLDAAMMRIVDILYALPFTIFVILLMTVFGRNFILLFVAIGAVEWLTMARIVRGQVLALKRQEFIEAAVALGLRKRRIVLRHVVPNVLGPVMVYTTLTIPAVMVLEAFLSFLRLGVQPPVVSRGRRRCVALHGGGPARHSRPARRDDISGSDDLAESVHDDRRAAHGTAADPRENRPGGSGPDGIAGAPGGRSSGGRAADSQLPAPVLRGHAPARDDRDGVDRQTRPADRG